MEKEKFYNFEGENTFLEFSGSDENEFSNVIGAVVAGVKARKRLKNLTNEEEARLNELENQYRDSGVAPSITKPKAKAKLLLEIQKRKNDEVKEIAKQLRQQKKANITNAHMRAVRLWEDARKKQIEQESLIEQQLNQAQENVAAAAQMAQSMPKLKLPKNKITGKIASKVVAPSTKTSLPSQPLVDMPVTDGVAAPIDESTSTTTYSTPTDASMNTTPNDKPNYMLWTGIGLAVLTLGFLAYRKYYTK